MTLIKFELKMLAESHEIHLEEVAMRKEQLVKIMEQQQKYKNLINKAQTELDTNKQVLRSHKELKEEYEKAFTDLRGKIQALDELLEKGKYYCATKT